MGYRASPEGVHPGFEVWGIDAAPSAIKNAREKAKEGGIGVNFLVGDALNLKSLQKKFNTVIECGLFHVFTDEERPIFAARWKINYIREAEFNSSMCLWHSSSSRHRTGFRNSHTGMT